MGGLFHFQLAHSRDFSGQVPPPGLGHFSIYIFEVGILKVSYCLIRRTSGIIFVLFHSILEGERKGANRNFRCILGNHPFIRQFQVSESV